MTSRSSKLQDKSKAPSAVTRRQFVQGLTVAGVLSGLGTWSPLRAASNGSAATELRGTEFDLSIGETPVNLTGDASVATTVNDSLPAPTLRWREGDTVTLRVNNNLSAETSIHWHGMVLPADMDGVPGVSFHGIAPGESFTYRFDVRQHGTYWYHAHSGFQEQAGLYGAIIIDPREPEPFKYDREHVILLSDWTDRDPLDVYRLLKRQPGYFNYNDRTLGDFVRDSRRQGLRTTLAERAMWGRMRMKPSDLADIGGHGYTYLVNGAAPAANWTGLFEPGERVRLRIINGSAMSIFDVRIPSLTMTVVAADGQYVRPVEVDEFRLSAAETLDVLVEPKDAEAFTIFAQSMDRAGYARGTLAVREGASAPVPALDEVAYLEMTDMGHGGSGDPASSVATQGTSTPPRLPQPLRPPRRTNTPRRRRPPRNTRATRRHPPRTRSMALRPSKKRQLWRQRVTQGTTQTVRLRATRRIRRRRRGTRAWICKRRPLWRGSTTRASACATTAGES